MHVLPRAQTRGPNLTSRSSFENRADLRRHKYLHQAKAMTSTSPRLLKPRSRLRLGALCFALGSLSLSGCTSVRAPIGGRVGGQASAEPGLARSWAEVWQRVRQAVAVGKASDERFLAARNNNSERFARAQLDLALLQLYSPAEAEARRGQAWSTQLAQAQSPDDKARLQASEVASYRRALELSPDGEFSSRDPDLLNALGYFLADKGSSRDDFERAERLARQALKEQDKALSEAREQGEDSTEFLSARYSRSNTRDSLAWALFKQAQANAGDPRRASQLLEQAQREQQAAVDEARQSLSALKDSALASPPSMSAELLYHLAMILRAQSSGPLASAHESQARDLLREAVALDPQFHAAREALER